LKCDRLSFSRETLLAYHQRNGPSSAGSIFVLVVSAALLLAQIAREYVDRAKGKS